MGHQQCDAWGAAGIGHGLRKKVRSRTGGVGVGFYSDEVM